MTGAAGAPTAQRDLRRPNARDAIPLPPAPALRTRPARTGHGHALATALLSLALAAPATAAAQSLATVQGFVSDDTGASLPGVTVELVDVERGQTRTAVTNPSGFFALRAVPSGEYDLVASLIGFRTARRENVRLLVGQSLEVDLRLGLAAVEETVLVTGEAPLIEVGRSGAAGYVTGDEIATCPSRAATSCGSPC